MTDQALAILFRLHAVSVSSIYIYIGEINDLAMIYDGSTSEQGKV